MFLSQVRLKVVTLSKEGVRVFPAAAGWGWLQRDGTRRGSADGAGVQAPGLGTGERRRVAFPAV